MRQKAGLQEYSRTNVSTTAADLPERYCSFSMAQWPYSAYRKIALLHDGLVTVLIRRPDLQSVRSGL
jgi:acyl carrier protein phosphodiesterase